MAATSVRRAATRDREACVATTTEAFRSDLSHRYFFPSAQRFPHQAAAFHRYLFDVRVDAAGIYCTADAGAVAIFEVPGAAPDSPRRADRWRECAGQMGSAAAGRIERYNRIVEGLMPSGDFWYLGLLATRPERRGEGLSRAVLSPVRQLADARSQTIVLETSSASNTRLYQHLGFEVRAQVVVDDWLPVWVMERHPGRGVWPAPSL